MKMIIVFAAIVALALSAPVEDKDVEILRYENDNIGVGGYKFNYELSDGQKRNEEAELKNVGTEDEALVLRGSYTYTGPDNVVYTVTYTADESGFHAEGAHLPVA